MSLALPPIFPNAAKLLPVPYDQPWQPTFLRVLNRLRAASAELARLGWRGSRRCFSRVEHEICCLQIVWLMGKKIQCALSPQMCGPIPLKVHSHGITCPRKHRCLGDQGGAREMLAAHFDQLCDYALLQVMVRRDIAWDDFGIRPWQGRCRCQVCIEYATCCSKVEGKMQQIVPTSAMEWQFPANSPH